MDSALGVMVGIGLAASCGFRVFAPLLVVSGASNAGYLELADGFSWMGTWPALVAFAVAAVVEIGAFYVPWLDNLLDALVSPIAVVAGAVLFAAVAFELDPFLRWSLAIIAGGGSAALVQGGTVLTRATSTTTTAGLANFVVSTVETIAGFVFSVLAIVVPLFAVLLLVCFVVVMYFVGRRVMQRMAPRGDGGI
jgi:hypothetical protein